MNSQGSVVWTIGPDVDGDSQMELDRCMARAAVANGKIYARFYHFVPPCVSLGCFQQKDEIDPIRCAEVGIDITRRPTGGRAVLHKGDLVYSVAVPMLIPGMEMPKGMIHVGVYNAVSEILQQAFNSLGLGSSAAHEKAEKLPDLPARARLCFSSATKYEVQIQGRKVVGSAQRKYRNVVLQHGSILVTDDHLQLVDLLPDLEDSTRKRLHDSMERKTISLRQAGFEGDEDVLIKALETSFEQQLGSLERMKSLDFVKHVESCSHVDLED